MNPRPHADARSSNPVVVSAAAEPRADLAVERSGRVCCCGHGFVDHDPATCTGKRCGCRGFHEPEARRALHVALDGGER